MKIYFALEDDGTEISIGFTRDEALDELSPHTMIRAESEERFTPLAEHPDFMPGSKQEQAGFDRYFTDGGKPVVSRVLAFLVDYFVFYVFVVSYVALVGVMKTEGEWAVNDAYALPVVLAWIIWFPVVEAIRGRSFGKSLLGLRIIDRNGDTPAWPALLKRRLLDLVEVFSCPFLALPLVVLGRYGQRLGDKWAGTVVVSVEQLDDEDRSDSPTSWR